MAKSKNNGIEILRLLLFSAVVLFHYEVAFTQLFWAPIETFFVISAFFLIKKLNNITTPPPKNYNTLSIIKNRIFRLYPVYLCVLAVCFLTAFIKTDSLPLKDTVIHGLFLQNYNWMLTNYSSDLVMTGHTWTLSIEVTLFILWVLAYKLIKSRKGRTAWNILMIFTAFSYRMYGVFAMKSSMVISLFPIAHADAFGLGALMASSIDMNNKKTNTKKGVLFSCGGLILIILSIIRTAAINDVSFMGAYSMYENSGNYLHDYYTVNIYMFISVFSVGLLYLFIAFNDFFSKRIFSKISSLGKYTYGAYLIHWPMLKLLQPLTGKNLPTAIFVGAASLFLSFALEEIFKYIKSFIPQRR